MLKTKHIIVLPVSLLVLTAILGTFLSSTVVKADNSTIDTVNVTVNTACTITTGGGTYSESITPGSSKEITSNNINVSCNDSGGYALYAIGFSGDSYDTPNNNRMLGPDSNYIPTANSGTNSYWAMKVAASSTTSTVPTIDNSYSSYQIIPATYTKISHYPSITVGTTTNSVTTPTYKVNVSPTQTAGTYTGKVKYTIVHPNDAPAPSTKLYMQDMVASDCTTTAMTVYDNRDEEPYLVQRLADGNCWMLDNLRLDLSNSTVLNNTTESNTNASTTTLNYLKNGGGSTSDRYPTAKINNVPWTSSDQNYYSVPMTISTYKDQTTTSYGEGSGKIGVYYNYCAASAGNYCFGDGTSAGSPSGNATEDICPKGWRMPIGGDSGEYQALSTAYSSGTSFRNALSTPLSGSFNSGSAYDQGTYGYFWSSTYNYANFMYLLGVSSSYVLPYGTSSRSNGYSVRCLLSS